MNTLHNIMLAGLLLGLAHAPAALADDPPAPAEAPSPPEVTMRIIENPDAVAPESITRRLQLPPAPPRDETRGQASGRERAQAPENEARRNEAAQEATERAREMAEQAAERREEFGRSRAEEMQPERPEPPQPPRP